MATLKTNTLTGTTTAGSIAVTTEGGAATTNLQQGLTKAWCTVNQESGISTADSFGYSSIADTRQGQTLNTMSIAMGNINYAIVQSEHDTDGSWTATGGISGAQAVSPWVLANTTTAHTIVRYTSGSQGEDTEYCAMVCGDSA